MKTIIKLFYCILASTILVGCATTKPVPKSVVTINNSKIEQVKNHFASEMIRRDFVPFSGDTLAMVFEKNASSGAQFFLRELGGQPVKTRIRYSLIQSDDAVNVYGTAFIVTTKFGTPQEEPLGPKIQSEFHRMMQEIAASMN